MAQSEATQVPYAGKYFDGKTTQQTAVTVTFGSNGIVLSPENGGAVIHWAYEDLDTVERLRPGKPVRLSPKLDHDARLLIDVGGFAEDLLAHAPQLQKRFGRRGLRRSEIRFIVIASVTSLALLAAFIPATNKYLVRIFPDSLERRLGNQTRALLIGGKAICRDKKSQAIMDSLAAQLTKDHPVANLRVRIVDFDLPNAFALAGGEVIFTRGIMKKFSSGNQFAGVLAHEIAHQREKHPVQAVLRVFGLEFIVQVLFGDDSIIAGLGGTALLLAYSREMEAEADAIAMQLLQDAKIDPSGLAGFFKILNAGKKSAAKTTAKSIFSYLSTHPGTVARIAALSQIGDTAGLPALSDADWRDLGKRCEAEFRSKRSLRKKTPKVKKSEEE